MLPHISLTCTTIARWAYAHRKGILRIEDELFRRGGSVLALIGLVLLVMWLLGFVAFHVTSGVIHVLLVLAIISIIVHFLRGRTVA
jgi:hypothetical protein